jgi:regulation of enolase protein 1 (concanavalin A-like superfamily)
VERNRKELERSDLYGRIEVYRRKEFEWEKSASEKDNEIRTLSRRISRQTSDLQRLEKQVDDMQTRLTTTMDAAQRREDDWNKAWSEKEQAMAALQARIQIANMERDKAQAYMARYGPGRSAPPPTSSILLSASSSSSSILPSTPTPRPTSSLGGGSGRRSSLDATNGTSTSSVVTNNVTSGSAVSTPSSIPSSSVRPDLFRTTSSAASSIRSPQQITSSTGAPTTPTTISFENPSNAQPNTGIPGSSIRPPRIFVSSAPGASPRMGSKGN